MCHLRNKIKLQRFIDGSQRIRLYYAHINVFVIYTDIKDIYSHFKVLPLFLFPVYTNFSTRYTALKSIIKQCSNYYSFKSMFNECFYRKKFL